MPIYTYTCHACSHTFDHLARSLSDRAKTCPQCGAANPRKQLAAFAAVAAKPARPAACGACDAAPRCPHACGSGCCH